MCQTDHADPRLNAAQFPARWVLAKSGLAHLERGERSSQSMRVKAEHAIVTLCRGHLDASAEEVPSTYARRCSNCVRWVLSKRSDAALDRA
jgi:hypothetical protein